MKLILTITRASQSPFLLWLIGTVLGNRPPWQETALSQTVVFRIPWNCSVIYGRRDPVTRPYCAKPFIRGRASRISFMHHLRFRERREERKLRWNFHSNSLSFWSGAIREHALKKSRSSSKGTHTPRLLFVQVFRIFEDSYSKWREQI